MFDNTLATTAICRPKPASAMSGGNDVSSHTPNFSKVSKIFAYYAYICDFLIKFAFKTLGYSRPDEHKH